MAMMYKPVRLLGVGAIVKLAVSAVMTFLKAVYRLIAYFKMRLVVLYLAVSALLVWTDVIKKPSSAYTTVLILGVLIFLLSLFAFARGISQEGEKTPKKTKEKRKKEQEQPQPTVEAPAGMPAFVLTPVGAQGGGTVPAYTPLPPSEAFEGRGEEERASQPKEERPRYYRVAQNPKYVMAEYSDRVELFYDAPGGLKYVRTDYKN